MSKNLPIEFVQPFVKSSKKDIIPIFIIHQDNMDDIHAALLPHQKDVLAAHNIKGKSKTPLLCIDDNGHLSILYILAPSNNNAQIDDGARLQRYIQANLADTIVKSHIFSFINQCDISQADSDDKNTVKTLTNTELRNLCIGWGMGAIRVHAHGNPQSKARCELSGATEPVLALPDMVEQDEIKHLIDAIQITRGMINIPANYMGTDELCDAAQALAAQTKGKCKIIKDKDLIKKNFPMIYAVGHSSHRRPALIDIKWPAPNKITGKNTNKNSDKNSGKNVTKITLVGKGIVYDTGGLDLKPSAAMRNMKKDMGGAAQAMGLAYAIQKNELPIELRLLIPAAENAVSSDSYRPGDVINSRKGLTVEISDTDAEGRLVLGDALTYACEENPDLIIDFATLTGAARVALGFKIGALMGNDETFTSELQNMALNEQDPLWTLPLWPDYDLEMGSTVADLQSIGTGRAGAIHGGLFLQRFMDNITPWMHLDLYAWEDNGRPAFDKGGIDQGLRAVYAYLKSKYA